MLHTFTFLVELFDGAARMLLGKENVCYISLLLILKWLIIDGDGRILFGKGHMCNITLCYLLKWFRSERHNIHHPFQINYMLLACIIFQPHYIPHTLQGHQ